jgi:predicted dehydrogenase
MPDRHHQKKAHKRPPLRVGVVGVGYLGAVHARIYAGMESVQLVGVADINHETAAAVGRKLGCAHFDDPEALIGRVDAVNVVVPTSQHQQVAEPYLKAGIPTLVEKPVAHSLKAARALVETAERSGTPLLVGHSERFNHGLKVLLSFVPKPRLIEAQRLGPFRERVADVDVVTDLMIHDIDFVLSLHGAEPVRVSVTGARVVTPMVDIANVRMEFADGAAANLVASRVSEGVFRRIRAFDRGVYASVNLVDSHVDVALHDEIRGDGEGLTVRTEKVDYRSMPQPLQAELAHFVDVAHGVCPPGVSGRDGLLAVKWVHNVLGRIKSEVP